MSATNDGGPAFPLATSCGSNTAVNGMSLRDHAVIQFIAAQIMRSGMDGIDINDTVIGANMIFDAMLAARGAK